MTLFHIKVFLSFSFRQRLLSSLPTMANEQVILICPTVRPSSLMWPSMQSLRWNGKPSVSILISSTSSFKLKGKQNKSTVLTSCCRWKMNWCQENEKLVKSSHPNLSAVTEDIRFNLQPVSISKFTSCPKHCIHRGGACKMEKKERKKSFIQTIHGFFVLEKNF